jgi:hypothetical protein
MQVDMHYYGTYAMARAAGLKADICKIIATAAEFVDDNAGHQNLNAKDQGHLHVTASAHHSANGNNLNNDDQRLVWVPFHFLPGNEGDSYELRLQCVKDSEIAQQMLAHHLSRANKIYGPHLIGVAAHVYADTFAHYGFSGISSPANYIDEDTIEFHTALPSDTKNYLQKKWMRFKTSFESDAAEALSKGLGHGAAHTYPDRPYLSWSFKYEDGRDSGIRDNTATFLEACEKLQNFFIAYGKANTDMQERPPTPFSDMKDTIEDLLSQTKRGPKRIEAWKDLIAAGKLFAAEQIPVYDASEWLNDLANIEEMEDSSKVIDMDVFKFLQATAIHRTFVLRELLPSHGLLVR